MSTNSCFTFRGEWGGKKSPSLMSLFLYELFESLAEECAALPPRLLSERRHEPLQSLA